MTRDNTAVPLIDHQVGLFIGVRDINVAELKHPNSRKHSGIPTFWTAPSSMPETTNASSPK